VLISNIFFFFYCALEEPGCVANEGLSFYKLSILQNWISRMKQSCGTT